jgi:hypothetical protein
MKNASLRVQDLKSELKEEFFGTNSEGLSPIRRSSPWY